MIRIGNSPIIINKPQKQIPIVDDKQLAIPAVEENSFENTYKKIESEKFIKPSLERQKKVLKEKSEELESVLVYQMLKVMKPKMSEGLFGGGNAEEIWSDMLYEEYAKNMSKTANFGLANQIYESLVKGLN